MEIMLYDQHQVDKILAAYQALFPNIDGTLAKYWDTSRQRKWSCVTSNFHTARYEQFKLLHDRTVKIDKLSMNLDEKGEALRQASIECGVGFSLGICAWTDNLLYETYSPNKDSITIILGHDWYPIVVADRLRSDSPLRMDDGLHHVNRYRPAAPQAIFDNETVALFFNLYPDYRPPGDGKCGSLRNYGYSYAECLNGLDAIIDSVSPRFKTVQLISWGSHVWAALKNRVHDIPNKKGLMQHAKEMSGKVMRFQSLGKDIPYLPIAHPSHAGNFCRDFHLNHVKQGFAAMGLGLPGVAIKK